MARSARLLELLQILRRHRYPVRGSDLARELGISLRTLYRDIATLQGQGAVIDGEPGLGYVMQPGFTLPPLMFSRDELEALALGSSWVADRGGSTLGAAARNALAKIAAVLPVELRRELDSSGLLVGPGRGVDPVETQLSAIREAIRLEHKIEIRYRDLQQTDSLRTIWPLALSFFDNARVLVAWCETRGAFRHFRMDRIAGIEPRATRYPRRRPALLREWRHAQGIPQP